MARGNVLVVVAVAVIAILGIYFECGHFNGLGAGRQRAVTAATAVPVDPHNDSLRSKERPALAPSMTEFRKLFSVSRNHLVCTRQVLPAAQAGNADAQFYLYRVLDYCQHEYPMYFVRRSRQLTYDEAVQWAYQRHLSIQVAQAVNEKCADLKMSDMASFGSSDEWLMNAAKQKQPLAESSV